jgi:hypothetical protein
LREARQHILTGGGKSVGFSGCFVEFWRIFIIFVELKKNIISHENQIQPRTTET